MTQPRVALYGACRAESERERWVEEQEMMIIAEISDKMLTVPWLWATMAVFAVPFLAGAARRWLACVLLPFALLLSGWMAYAAYHEAFLEAGMKEAIHHEMGTWWIINSISSACLPGMAAIGVMAWTMRKTRQPNQASEGIPRKLGNPQGWRSEQRRGRQWKKPKPIRICRKVSSQRWNASTSQRPT